MLPGSIQARAAIPRRGFSSASGKRTTAGSSAVCTAARSTASNGFSSAPDVHRRSAGALGRERLLLADRGCPAAWSLAAGRKASGRGHRGERELFRLARSWRAPPSGWPVGYPRARSSRSSRPRPLACRRDGYAEFLGRHFSGVSPKYNLPNCTCCASACEIIESAVSQSASEIALREPTAKLPASRR